jgi:hypothetical protein
MQEKTQNHSHEIGQKVLYGQEVYCVLPGSTEQLLRLGQNIDGPYTLAVSPQSVRPFKVVLPWEKT